MKTIAIGDFLTEGELKRAIKLRTARKIADEIIIPNMERINAALGQENDALYLGYAVEYAISQMEARGRSN